ncbi:E3 ubiquitin-protein ligase MYLIP-A [Zerene cesonia]|uniref:E3 ubiquitin-protein ligase MYLIP-A n=1 Tax=Zerene cesonia TaxID=33412 RepID=UPI0018E5766A|nr:E3 ubiquitin-protein ligase MYLIP-A [Zerene cesonia]
MWLVSQPNSVILEVKVDSNAIGQQLLERVCEKLEIGAEADYFGLRVCSGSGPGRWLNLRNPLDPHRIPGGRLDLRVKFWVPPHIAGMRASQAEYRLLKEISKLESFGEELFFCKPVTASNNAHNLYSHLLYHTQQAEEPRARDEQEIDGGATVGCLTSGQSAAGCGCRLSTCVGVGPHGIVVYRPACNGEQDIGVEKQSIPYTAIHRAQPLRRIFQLSYVSGAAHAATLHVKMATSGQAAALYRAVTEKHAFYCCETVRSDVTEQFIRDLKGTIASIFNDSTTLGRRYVFDIRRTCREVHDRARRDAHARELREPRPPAPRAPRDPRPPRARPGDESSRSRSRSRSASASGLACRACMDAAIDTLFLPCRHVVCCGHCATRCERCPLCRGEIEKLMHIFLPVEYQKSTGVIIK